MTSRKITIDNSVRYIPKSEQTKEIKQNKMKNKKIKCTNPTYFRKRSPKNEKTKQKYFTK